MKKIFAVLLAVSVIFTTFLNIGEGRDKVEDREKSYITYSDYRADVYLILENNLSEKNREILKKYLESTGIEIEVRRYLFEEDSKNMALDTTFLATKKIYKTGEIKVLENTGVYDDIGRRYSYRVHIKKPKIFDELGIEKEKFSGGYEVEDKKIYMKISLLDIRDDGEADEGNQNLENQGGKNEGGNFSTSLGAGGSFNGIGTNISRISGDDRIKTAVEVSRTYYKKSDYIILARSDSFPDSLTSTVLAKKLDAPILLTTKDEIDIGVSREISRLGAKNIIVVGGYSSISKKVEGVLKRVSTVERIGGRDRYETSSLIAKKILGKDFQNINGRENSSNIKNSKNSVVIASGEVFSDALSISPYASKMGYPILLTQKNNLPSSITRLLKEYDIGGGMVVGGENSVSKKVSSSLGAGFNRYFGVDRYETSKEISRMFFQNSSIIYISSGEVFSDSLVIGPIAAKTDSPIILVGGGNSLSYISDRRPSEIVAIGGRARISEDVLNRFRNIVEKIR